MPSGFAKAYARAVGEDEVEIARGSPRRSEIDRLGPPSRICAVRDRAILPRGPSRGRHDRRDRGSPCCCWSRSACGYGTNLFRGDGLDSPARWPAETFAPRAGGDRDRRAGDRRQVMLVATDEVWMRIYDADGDDALEGTLAPGERYDVPADAQQPDDQRRSSRQIAGARSTGRQSRRSATAASRSRMCGISAAALRAAASPPPPRRRPGADAGAESAPAPRRGASQPSAPPACRPRPTPHRRAPGAASTGRATHRPRLRLRPPRRRPLPRRQGADAVGCRRKR